MSWIKFETDKEKVKVKREAIVAVALRYLPYADDERYEVVVALNCNNVTSPALGKEEAEKFYNLFTGRQEQDSKEPLQCPFCGSKDVFVESDPNEGYYCHCMTCESFGPFGETKKEAIGKWNRREGC